MQAEQRGSSDGVENLQASRMQSAAAHSNNNLGAALQVTPHEM